MRYNLLIIVLLFSSNLLLSQDAVLSQYNSFPLYTNMAMAGSKGCSRVITGTRLQWLNMNGGYKTNYFSYDQYSRHLRSGFGVQYYKCDEGNGMLSNEFVHLSFSPSISIHWKTSEDSLRWFVVKPAINFGLLDERIDWSKYNFGDMIDPLYGYISNTQEVKNRETIMAPDFGAGMFFYGNKFFGGIYFQHITEPEVGSLFTGSPYPAKLTIHGGYLMNGYKWLGNFELIPSFIYEYQQESRTDLSVIAKYRKYSLGIGARPGSAFMFMAGFEYKFFKIGYSYDLSVTHAAWTVGSTHEIMIGFNFANRKEHKKIRTLDFPVL